MFLARSITERLSVIKGTLLGLITLTYFAGLWQINMCLVARKITTNDLFLLLHRYFRVCPTVGTRGARAGLADRVYSNETCCQAMLPLADGAGALTGLVPALHAAAAGCFPAPAGLVGWWPGDGNANDIASTNNGTLEGGATASAAGSLARLSTSMGPMAMCRYPTRRPSSRPTSPSRPG